MSASEIEKIITNKFAASSFVYYDDIPMDGEIADFIYDINKSSNIITTNSCAGHDKFESNATYDFISHPYLAFIVNKTGWLLFWNHILPEISKDLLIHIDTCTMPGKEGIIIRCHYDDKKAFWIAIRSAFQKYFPSENSHQ